MNKPEPLDPITQRLLDVDEALEQRPESLLDDATRQRDSTLAGNQDAHSDTAHSDIGHSDNGQFDTSAEECLKLIEAIRVIHPEALADAFEDPGGGASLGTTVVSFPTTQLGRFQLLRRLGQGGYGVVFLAHDPALDRELALKVPRPEVLLTETLRHRFLREAESAAALDHPNIVPVFEAGSAGPICYIASAFCRGGSLSEWLQSRRQVLPPAVAARVIVALAGAVQHAHDRGIIHRDIKPSNVLIDIDAEEFDPGQVRLADFGLAGALVEHAGDDSDAKRQRSASTLGGIVGTPAYMAPEQAKNQRHLIGPTTDVYGLGATLYQLLTGRPPLVAASPIETMAAIARDEPLDVHHQAQVPRDLSAICMKALRKEASERYGSAQELQDDLQRFLDGAVVNARPLHPARKVLRWSARNPVTSILATSFVVFIAAAAIVFGTLWVRAERHRVAAETQSVQLTDSLHSLFRMLATSEEMKQPIAEPMRRRVIQQAEQVYATIADKPNDDWANPQMEFDRARSVFEVGRILDAMGDSRNALEKYADALDRIESLPARELQSCQRTRNSNVGSWWIAQGHVQTKLGDFEAASQSFASALAYFNRWKANPYTDGDDDWLTITGHAATVGQQALSAIQAKNVNAAVELSRLSEEMWRNAMRRQPLGQWSDTNRAALANSLLILGQVYDVANDLPKSEALLAEAIPVAASVDVMEVDDIVAARGILPTLHHRLGIAQARQERYKQARANYATALKLFDAIIEDQRDNINYRQFRSSARYSLAFTEFLSEDFARASELVRGNIAEFEELIKRAPDQAAVFWDRIGDNYCVLSSMVSKTPEEDPEPSIAALQHALDAYDRSLKLRADWREPMVGRAKALIGIGDLYQGTQDSTSAAESYQAAINVLQKVVKESPGWPEATERLQEADQKLTSLKTETLDD